MEKSNIRPFRANGKLNEPTLKSIYNFCFNGKTKKMTQEQINTLLAILNIETDKQEDLIINSNFITVRQASVILNTNAKQVYKYLRKGILKDLKQSTVELLFRQIAFLKQIRE